MACVTLNSDLFAKLSDFFLWPRLLALVLMNVLFVVLSPFALYEIGFGYAIALPNILSSRILLNLRECERTRAQRVDVHGLAVEQWETMFHIT